MVSTAIIINPVSADYLRWQMRESFNLEEKSFICESKNGKLLPHHAHVNLGEINTSLNPRKFLHKTVQMVIYNIWASEQLGVCAAEICTAKVGGEIIKFPTNYPHIVICIKPPATLFDAHYLFFNEDNCVFLPESLIIEGIFCEIDTKKTVLVPDKLRVNLYV